MVVQTRVTQALRVRPEAAASSSRGGQPVAAMEIQDDTESRPRAALQALLHEFPAHQVDGTFSITELIKEGPAQEACSRIFTQFHWDWEDVVFQKAVGSDFFGWQPVAQPKMSLKRKIPFPGRMIMWGSLCFI